MWESILHGCVLINVRYRILPSLFTCVLRRHRPCVRHVCMFVCMHCNYYYTNVCGIVFYYPKKCKSQRDRRRWHTTGVNISFKRKMPKMRPLMCAWYCVWTRFKNLERIIIIIGNPVGLEKKHKIQVWRAKYNRNNI